MGTQTDQSHAEIKKDTSEDLSTLSTAQIARAERNRQRARALRDARLLQHPVEGEAGRAPAPTDSGGGFLLEDPPAPPPRAAPRPAPIVHPAERPQCLECENQFAASYLLDTFDYNVCDECRNEEAHSLITRTEAKTEYLLKDCDLDLRPPPLRCVRRRNPHSARFGDMRLYLRAQVEARALQVWGSPARLEAELQERDRARERSRRKQTERRLRALRMDVRSSLFDRSARRHEHSFAPEQYDDGADVYSRTCSTCGHVETYEKM